MVQALAGSCHSYPFSHSLRLYLTGLPRERAIITHELQQLSYRPHIADYLHGLLPSLDILVVAHWWEENSTLPHRFRSRAECALLVGHHLLGIDTWCGIKHHVWVVFRLDLAKLGVVGAPEDVLPIRCVERGLQ